MRWVLLAIVMAIGGTAQAQEASIRRLRELASRDDPGLVAAVREQPEDARELFRRLLVQAGARAGRDSDSALVTARVVATVMASTLGDSFPTLQIARFARMPPADRRAKIAADSVRRAGNAARATGGVAAALPLWREAHRRSATIGDSVGVAAALGNIGAGLFIAGTRDSAMYYLTRAVTIADAAGDRRTALNATDVMGSMARDAGDLRHARELYERALARRAAIGDIRGACAEHNNLGLIFEALGDASAASAHYEQAFALAHAHGLDEPEAAALINLGNLAAADGRFAESIRRYDSALRIYRATNAEADVALVLHDVGLVAMRRGDYREARARLVEALAIYTRSGTVDDRVAVRSDLATVLAASGDMQGARLQLRQAERLVAGRMGDDLMAAGVALTHADLAVHLNSPDEADRQFARAEALYRRAGDVRGEAEAQRGRAILLSDRHQYPRSLSLLTSAQRRLTATGDRRAAALAMLMIGDVQRQAGNPVAARRALESARDSLRTLGDAVGEAAAMRVVGDLELDANEPLVAESIYRQALARIGPRAAPTTTWQLHAALGDALRMRGALADAASELRQAIGDIERMASSLALEERRSGFMTDKWDPYAQLAMVELQRGDTSGAFDASERMRARQMLDLLARGRVSSGEAADSSLVVRTQDIRRRVDVLTRRLEAVDGSVGATRGVGVSAEQTAAAREALARARDEYAQALLDLRESATAYGRIARGESVTWHDVARRLAPGEVMLEYLVADSTTIVFAITADTLRAVNLGVGRRVLEPLIDFARGSLTSTRRTNPGRGMDAPWRAPLRRLYQYLVAPVEETGVLSAARTLVVVPNADLNYLPFATLLRTGPDRRDEFLVQRFAIGYAPSASVRVRLSDRRPAALSGVLAMAPRPDELPGSRREVASIGALYGTQANVLVGAAATEAAFRASANRYGVLHLATSGLLNKQNPLFSFVALGPGDGSDGRLEVHEVLGMTLHARLVVLSACQTALASGAIADVPPGDDWVGLVQAFLGAGADHVLATLWPVEDRSTAWMMERVHRRLHAGESAVVAVAEAQREALRKSDMADPFYWGGFVLVGAR